MRNVQDVLAGVVVDQSSKSSATATYAIVFVIVKALEVSAISHSVKVNTKRLLLWGPETEPKKFEQDLKGRRIDEATFFGKGYWQEHDRNQL